MKSMRYSVESSGGNWNKLCWLNRRNMPFIKISKFSLNFKFLIFNYEEAGIMNANDNFEMKLNLSKLDSFAIALESNQSLDFNYEYDEFF